VLPTSRRLSEEARRAAEARSRLKKRSGKKEREDKVSRKLMAAIERRRTSGYDRSDQCAGYPPCRMETTAGAARH